MAQPAHLNVAFMGGRNAGSKANMEEISDKMKGEGTKRKKKRRRLNTERSGSK